MGWSGGDLPDMAGKVVVVTGANAGLGFQAAKALSKRNARVILTARSEEKGLTAVQAIKADAPDALVEYMALDLASFESVRSFVAAFLERKLPLHVLIANAGVFMPPFSQTQQGFEVSVGVKHFGHFLLVQLLADNLRESAPARVVFVSGSAEKGAVIDWDDLACRTVKDSGMGQAARANLYILMDALEFSRRFQGSGVEVFATHPGLAKTEWSDKIDRSSWVSWVLGIVGPWLAQSSEDGVLSTLYAAAAPEAAGKSSAYFGPHYMVNWGNTTIRQPKNPLATDPQAAARLYDETVKIIAACS